MHLQYIVSRRGRVGSSKEYHTCMYAHMRLALHCASCGAKHGHNERFNRHCVLYLPWFGE